MVYDYSRVAGRHEDALVKDPDLLPKKLSQRYVKDLKKGIGRGTQVKVVKSETTMPRGWTFGNYTVLEITLPNKETLKASLTLNVADNEASGNVNLDAKYGGVISMQRASTAEPVLKRLISETVDHLKTSEKTAYSYAR